jgi:hypothetical protein
VICESCVPPIPLCLLIIFCIFFVPFFRSRTTNNTTNTTTTKTKRYIIIVVLMLNLLIAIMGNAYAQIAKNEAVEMQRERAKAILSIEQNLLTKKIKETWSSWFPNYLHVLEPHASKEGAVDKQATAELRMAAHFDERMRLVERQFRSISEGLKFKVAGIMSLLGSGMMIKRKDHQHNFRYVPYKIWVRVIPEWRCSTCLAAFSSKSKELIVTEPPCFVCEKHFHGCGEGGSFFEAWKPPPGCDFTVCLDCVQNQTPLPRLATRKVGGGGDRFDRDARATAEKREEEELLREEEIASGMLEDEVAANDSVGITSMSPESSRADMDAADAWAALEAE